MTPSTSFRRALILIALGAASATTTAHAQSTGRARIDGQLAQDFVAGKVPRSAEIEEAEKDAAANPNDASLQRRLAKGYFFQFFGGGNKAAYPKALEQFDKVLALKADDPETLVYKGSIIIFNAARNEKDDAAAQKASFDKGFALVQKAQQLAPRDGAVMSVSSATYLELPASYGMAPQVVGMLEGMRKGMGPAWEQFSHHGRQRLLLTLGRAYAQTGNVAKARANFDEALAINGTSTEAGLIKAELSKLP